MALLGREEEFQAFVEEHRSLWYRLAYRVLENREEAEDVVQETLAILWEKNEDSLGNYDELDPEELEQAIEELPESQQVVIRMKYYMGFSFREIGEALQISLNTAGSRCRYALETLKELLGGDNEED
jgi:RNA polymerase sigma-70 factor (ECF subfamily)